MKDICVDNYFQFLVKIFLNILNLKSLKREVKPERKNLKDYGKDDEFYYVYICIKV